MYAIYQLYGWENIVPVYHQGTTRKSEKTIDKSLKTKNNKS